VAALPENVLEEFRKRFKITLENTPHAHVDATLADGEELPFLRWNYYHFHSGSY